MKIIELEEIQVKHSSIDEIPQEADLIITHKNLTPRVRQRAPDCEHLSVESFTDMKVYDDLMNRLRVHAHK